MPLSPIRKLASTFLFALLIFSQTAKTQVKEWDVRVTPFNEVFPALDLSQASREVAQTANIDALTLGNGSGLIALRLRARHDGERIRVMLSAPPWLKTSGTFDVTLPQANCDYELHPPVDWDAQSLAVLRSPIATTLRFALQRDGVDSGLRAVPINLHPLGEALYFVRDGAESVDLSWIFAAYADEADPVVNEILASALKNGIVEKFSGYDRTDNADDVAEKNEVLRQVWAIWDALATRGIRYSNADPGIDRGPKVFSQRVRFLADTWNDRSANCIDGSVLLISALQRIGLQSYLVLVPGHAFVGFYTDAQKRHSAYLETTLLGDRLALPQTLPIYAEEIALTRETRASLASFEAALREGATRYARDADRFDGSQRPDYAIIDIAAARAFGIRPIAPVRSDTAAR